MRKQAREVAFKMVFENLFRDSDVFNETSFSVLQEDENLCEEDANFSRQIFDAFIDNKHVLIAQVQPALNGYELARAYKIDLALILVALAEISYVGTDKKIVINEVVDMAKKFSTDKSPSYINGVLSTLVNKNDK